jgi:hypothetical protein
MKEEEQILGDPRKREERAGREGRSGMDETKGIFVCWVKLIQERQEMGSFLAVSL